MHFSSQSSPNKHHHAEVLNNLSFLCASSTGFLKPDYFSFGPVTDNFCFLFCSSIGYSNAWLKASCSCRRFLLLRTKVFYPCYFVASERFFVLRHIPAVLQNHMDSIQTALRWLLILYVFTLQRAYFSRDRFRIEHSFSCDVNSVEDYMPFTLFLFKAFIFFL